MRLPRYHGVMPKHDRRAARDARKVTQEKVRSSRETKTEKLFKRERGLDPHVRVALGGRPKRTVPVPLGQTEGPRGLGDLVARWTKAIGLKQCEGCRRRQRVLNRRFPFHRAQG